MKTVKKSVTLIMLTLAVTILAILGVYFATLETGTVAENAVSAADITLTDEEKAATVGLHGDVIGTDDHDHTGAELLTQASGTVATGSYYLNGDLELDGELTIAADVKLCLNGHKLFIKDGVQSRVVSVTNSGTFALYDCEGGGMITGGNIVQSNGAGVNIADGGTMTMYGGAVVGNTASYEQDSASYGGGIYGNVILKKGVIKGNTAYIGGGISASQLDATDALITGNVAGRGGGVFVNGRSSSSTFTGCTISDNIGDPFDDSTETGGGGGVFAEDGAAVLFTDTRITGNRNNGVTSRDFTRGVALSGNVLIENNTSGGIYTWGNVDIQGGTIIARNNDERSMDLGYTSILSFSGALTEESYVAIAIASYTDGIIVTENFSQYHDESALNKLLVSELTSTPNGESIEIALSNNGEIEFHIIKVPPANYWVKTPPATKVFDYYTTMNDGDDFIPEPAFGTLQSVEYFSDSSCSPETKLDIPHLEYAVPVGMCYIRATVAAVDVYPELVTVFELEVTPASFDVRYIKIEAYTGAYDEKAHSPAKSAACYTYGSQPYTFKYTTDTDKGYTEDFALTDAGEYTVYYELSAPNYFPYYGEFTAKITQAQNSITDVGITGATYGSDYTPVTTANWGGDTATYTYSDSPTGTFTATKPTAAGTHYVKATIAETNNYAGAESAAFPFTISPKTVSVNWTNKTLTYNGLTQAPTATVDTGIESVTCAVTVTGGKIDAGKDYTATASTDNGNFTLTDTATQFTISPKTLIVKWGETLFTYDGEGKQPEATADTGISGVECVLTVKGLQTNAGQGYPATASTDDPNFTLNGDTTTFAIAPKSITVVWSDTELTYNGNEQKPTATVVTGIDGVPCAVTVTGGRTNAGKYSASAGTTNPNFTLENATVNYTIGKASYTGVTHDELTGTYSAAKTLADYALAENFTWTDGTETPTVGKTEYAAKYNADPDNYNDYRLDITLTLAKADYDMTGVAFESLTVTYDGKAHSVAVTGLPAGVTVEYDKATSYTNAGEYVITASLTGDAENYNLLEAMTATLNITKATYDMTGVAFEDLKVTYNGKAHAIEVTGLPAGVSVAYDKATSYTNAGEYVITATFTASDTTNYNALSVTTLTATLTIDKATYDMSGVRFSDATVTYNGAAHSIEATNLPTGVTVTYEDNGQTQAGTYTVKATFTGDANHEAIEAMEVTLTINKAVYDMSSVIFDNVTVTYDGASHSLAIAGTLPAGVTVTYENNGKTEVGTYTVIAKFTGDADNYEAIANKTATLTINAQAVEQEKGGCGGMVMDGVTIGGIALAALVVGVILIARRKRSK